MHIFKNNSSQRNQTNLNSNEKGWQKIGQQLKSFFATKPDGNQIKNEIDYYHQYVYPKKIETILENKNKSKSRF